MAPRERSLDRRPPSRPMRRSVLVVIGADRTEKAYLTGLRRHFGLTTVAVTYVEKPCAPDQLVEHARMRCRSDDYDEVWCVTDVDHFEREGRKVTAALDLAARADPTIRVAVSNPCFELWLLLHHEDCSVHCANCDAVHRKLRRRVPAYDKTRLRFRDYADGVGLAITRAKALDPTGVDHTRNPSTGLWCLVSVVMEKQ